MRLKRILFSAILIYALLLIIVTNCPAQDDPEITVIRDILQEQVTQIDKWENKANLLVFLTILVGVLGVATGALQKIEKKWSKAATMFAGALIGLITVVNNTVFEVDHRTLRAKTVQSRKIVQDIRILLAQEINRNSEEDRQVWLNEIREKLNQLSDISVAIYSQVNMEKSFQFTAELYAQSPAQTQEQPDWITHPLEDKINFYFVGVGEGTTLSTARDYSQQNAVDQAVQFLTAEFKTKQSAEPVSIDIEALTNYLLKSAKVLNKHFDYSRSDSLYHFYTLLSLNRMSTVTDVKLFAVQQRMVVPQVYSKLLQEAESPVVKQATQVVATYKSMMSSAKDSLSTKWYKKFLEAQQLRRSGKFTRAIDILKEILRENPEFYLGWYNLALAYDDGFNDFTKADQAYQKAADLEPKQAMRHASLYNTYGYFLLKHKKYPEAIVNFKKTLEIDPNHPYAGRNLKAAEAVME